MSCSSSTWLDSSLKTLLENLDILAELHIDFIKISVWREKECRESLQLEIPSLLEEKTE